MEHALKDHGKWNKILTDDWGVEGDRLGYLGSISNTSEISLKEAQRRVTETITIAHLIWIEYVLPIKPQLDDQ